MKDFSSGKPHVNDVERAPEDSYSPLLGQPEPASSNRRLTKTLLLVFVSMLLFSAFIAVVLNLPPRPGSNAHNGVRDKAADFKPVTSPGKVSRPVPDARLEWERTAFHFQPEKNFMSDPNGPLYYMGWYHLFYQYDPFKAIWGNMSWGHAVSKDMINWFHLPVAMVPDKWYDIEGVLTGSATILPNGDVIMLFTGNAYDFSQLQCLAYAVNKSDPLLIEWAKYEGNPILYPPEGVGLKDFRDPTSAWMGPDGKYRVAMGSRRGNRGLTLMYHTTDFIHYELLDEEVHGVNGTGMWECVDLYPVSTTNDYAYPDPTFYGPGFKHVLKESWDGHGIDWYAIGSYDLVTDKWVPDNPEIDVGIGLKYDYGKFYASKSFYDPIKRRRVLWGYVGETDPKEADLIKGWATILNFPRTIVLDRKTMSNILQWPIEEIENLRTDYHEFENVELGPGSIVPLHIPSATQLDIIATFEIDQGTLTTLAEVEGGYSCPTSMGSVRRGVLGPFGVVVLADESLTEQTPIYFYIARNANGTTTTHFCTDKLRSSKAEDAERVVYGSTVPVLDGENYSVRLLVDHSMVESFAQGGRTVVTSRVYPTKAIYEAAKIFVFNNATGISVKASVKIWQMGEAKFHGYPF